MEFMAIEPTLVPFMDYDYRRCNSWVTYNKKSVLKRYNKSLEELRSELKFAAIILQI